MLFSDDEPEEAGDEILEQAPPPPAVPFKLPQGPNVVMVFPPPTAPKIAPKAEKKDEVNPFPPEAPLVLDDPDPFLLPRPRKGSAPNRPLPKPFARPDQNILVAMKGTSETSLASTSSSEAAEGVSVPPPLTQAIPSPKASVISNASTVSTSSTDAVESPAASEEPLTMLKRQRSLSVPHVKLRPIIQAARAQEAPGEGLPTVPPKPSAMFPPALAPKPSKYLNSQLPSAASPPVAAPAVQGSDAPGVDSPPRPPPPKLKPKPSMPQESS